MKRITDFFLLCSGVNVELLDKCPTERSKYASIGATVFFTGVFAALSCGYALHTVFDSLALSVGAGLLWGLMIFNLDRYIVSSMRKENRPGREMLMALPRLVLAVLISIVIAKPLELKIFEKEIEPQLTIMDQRSRGAQEREVQIRFTGRADSLRRELSAIDLRLDEKRRNRDEFLRIAREEADGTGGSRIRNAGPIYQIKKRDAEKAQAELEQLERELAVAKADVRMELLRNDSVMRTELAGLAFVRRNGIAARLEALSILEESSVAIRIAGIFIMLLFIAIETAPVFVKLISPKGPYDNLINSEEFRFSCVETSDMAEASSIARKQVESLQDPEKSFAHKRLEKALLRNDIP